MPPATPSPNPIMYSPVDPQGQMPSAIPQQQQPAPQPTAAPVAPAAHASWWEKLLPTLGGIGGGLLGSLAGGVGAIGGAAGGGALGQKLENTLTGSTGSTATAGLENAVGSGVGGALGKVGSLLAGKVIAPLAEKGATQLVAGQAPGVTKDLATYVTKDLGMTNLEKAGQVSDVMTGGADRAAGVDGQAELTKVVENGLSNSPLKTLDLSNFIALNPAAKNAAVTTSAAADNVIEQAIKGNNLLGTPSGDAIRTKVGGIMNSFDNPGSVQSLDALGAQRDVASLASKEYNTFNTTRDPAAMDRYGALQQINQGLKGKLQLDQIPLAPTDQEALASNLEKYIAPIDKGAATNIGNQVRNLTAEDGSAPTLADVRNMESNFVQIKSALQDAQNTANKNFGTSTANIARQTLPVAASVAGMGGPKSLLGTVGGLATASPTADKVGAAGLNAVAKGAQGKIAQKVLPLATRASIIAAANLPNIAGSPNSPQGATIPTGTNQMNNGQTPGSPYNSLVNSMLAEAILAPNLAGNSGASGILNTLAPSLQKGAVGQQQLGGLQQQFGAAGGAQGIGGGGIIDTLLSKIPGTAQHAALNQGQQLTSSLGVSPGLAPSFLQNPGVAGTQMSTLQAILNAIGGGTTSAVPAQPVQ
jgi:hypothetical protein